MASAKYEPVRLTAKGRALLAKVQAGRGNKQITRFATGSGIYLEGEDYTKQVDLKDPKQEFAITSVNIESDDSVLLEVTITNKLGDSPGLEEGYKIREMAFYATDPDEGEICYCIMVGTDDLRMDYMPAYDGTIPSMITNYFYVKVADASHLQITVADPDNMVASQEGANGFRIYEGKMQYQDQTGFWRDVDTDASSMTVNIFEEIAEEFPDLTPGDSLKVLFGKIKKSLENVKIIARQNGRVLFGNRDTPMEVNDTLFIVEGQEPEPEGKFEGAAYTNMEFDTESPPESSDIWGKIEPQRSSKRTGEIPEENIIKGKLVVSEESPSDATFFAKINQ